MARHVGTVHKLVDTFLLDEQTEALAALGSGRGKNNYNRRRKEEKMKEKKTKEEQETEEEEEGEETDMEWNNEHEVLGSMEESSQVTPLF